MGEMGETKEAEEMQETKRKTAREMGENERNGTPLENERGLKDDSKSRRPEGALQTQRNTPPPFSRKAPAGRLGLKPPFISSIFLNFLSFPSHISFLPFSPISPIFPVFVFGAPLRAPHHVANNCTPVRSYQCKVLISWGRCRVPDQPVSICGFKLRKFVCVARNCVFCAKITPTPQ